MNGHTMAQRLGAELVGTFWVGLRRPVNPARSTGPALFAGSDPIMQLWAFWLAPIVGALIAGATYVLVLGGEGAAPLEEATQA